MIRRRRSKRRENVERKNSVLYYILWGYIEDYDINEKKNYCEGT